MPTSNSTSPPQSDNDDTDSLRQVYFATFPRSDEAFSEIYIASVRRMNVVQHALSKWPEALNFAQAWTSNIRFNTLFDKLFKDHSFGSMTAPIKSIAESVVQRLRSTPLATVFQTESSNQKTPPLKFIDILGRLEENRWISGSVLLFALTHALRHRNDVVVIDPLAARLSITSPPFDIHRLRFLIQPVIIGDNHWGVIIYQFDWANSKSTVLFYDPLNNATNRVTLASVWETYTMPLVDKWHSRDHAGRSTGEILSKVINSPMQDDNNSCGFLCLLRVMIQVEGFRLREDFVYEEFCEEDNAIVSAIYPLDLSGLRIMHLILNAPRRAMSAEAEARVQAIEQKIQIHAPDTLVMHKQ